MQTLFTYGSLKKGFHNYDRYLQSEKFVASATVKGEMYSCGSYPALYKGADTISGEIYTITDDVFLRILGMELRAGYSCEEVLTSKGYAYIFYYAGDDALKLKGRYIASGNWQLSDVKK